MSLRRHERDLRRAKNGWKVALLPIKHMDKRNFLAEADRGNFTLDRVLSPMPGQECE